MSPVQHPPPNDSDATEPPFYTTADAVRAELGVDATVLPDAAALKLIADAEDQVDELLGGWPVQEETGRKIAETDVMYAWQWDKLSRATAKFAAALYSEPGLLTKLRYRREKGPDFEVEDPRLGGPLVPVMTLLNASGLRRIAGRATPGLRRPRRERRFRDYPR